MQSGFWFLVFVFAAGLFAAGGSSADVGTTEPVEIGLSEAEAAVRFTPGWFESGEDVDSVGLPVGRQTLAGVEWKIEPGRALAIRHDQPGTHVAIGRRASRLHFLHTFRPGPAVADWHRGAAEAREVGDRLPDRLTVFRYLVRYADGHTVPLNVRWNEGIGAAVRGWWNPVDGFIYDLCWARIAWQRRTSPNSRRSTVVYAMYWPNPRPKVAIDEVIIEPPRADVGSGVLLALSTELSEPQGRTFFVAPDGSDDAPGSFDQPWATLQEAADRIRAGDTVYVRGGEYRLKERVLFEDMGDPDRWTSIIGYPGETATLNCLDVLWDRSPERVKKGWETYPHDVGMLLVHRCSRFIVKNLSLEQSRARGFMAEYGDHVEFLYNRVYRTYATGMRIGRARGPGYRAVGNVLVRPNCKEMGSRDNDELGVIGRKPPLEGMDVGTLRDFEIAHNEICWGDKEAMLLDGSSKKGRVHHNYVHDLHNRPWVSSISPNGYGSPEDIEIACNIVHDVGMGPGVGSEGGGHARRISIHHNVVFDVYWAALHVSGAWKNDASISDVSIYNNTLYNNGYLESNRRPAGGVALSFPREGLEGEFHNIRVFNNIIVGSRDYAVSVIHGRDLEGHGIEVLNNLIDEWVDNTQGTAWEAVRGENLVIADPQFVAPENGDFRLQPDSPAIDAGYAPDGARDPDGTTPDLGALPYHQGENIPRTGD